MILIFFIYTAKLQCTAHEIPHIVIALALCSNTQPYKGELFRPIIWLYNVHYNNMSNKRRKYLERTKSEGVYYRDQRNGRIL